MLRINSLSRSAATHTYQRPRFVDTARQAIETEMAAKAKLCSRGSFTRRSGCAGNTTDWRWRIRDAKSNRLSYPRARYPGSECRYPQEARDAIAGELGALQAEFARIGGTTPMGNSNLADGGSLEVVASDSGSLIEQSLPTMGPTALSLSNVDTAPPRCRHLFCEQCSCIYPKRPRATRCF